MKTSIITLLLGLCSYVVVGQNDHLEPIIEYPTIFYEEELADYENAINKLCCFDNGDSLLSRYTISPSFSGEYSIALMKDSSANYYAIERSFSENYWYAKDKESVTIKEVKRPLNPELSIKLLRLFETAINKVNVISNISVDPETGDTLITMGLDGITYTFEILTDSTNILSGKTWSPKKGTKMYELVQICGESLRLTESNTKKSNKKLIRLIARIETLLVRLERE